VHGDHGNDHQWAIRMICTSKIPKNGSVKGSILFPADTNAATRVGVYEAPKKKVLRADQMAIRRSLAAQSFMSDTLKAPREWRSSINRRSSGCFGGGAVLGPAPLGPALDATKHARFHQLMTESCYWEKGHDNRRSKDEHDPQERELVQRGDQGLGEPVLSAAGLSEGSLEIFARSGYPARRLASLVVLAAHPESRDQQ
jgi:hypothetical protein